MIAQFDLIVAAQAITLLGGLAIIIQSLETLSTNADFDDGGFHSWRVIKFDYLYSSSVFNWPVFTVLASRFSMSVLMVLRLAAVVMIGLEVFSALPGFEIWAHISGAYLLGVACFFHMRTPFGLDGSDQLILLLSATMACTSFIHADPLIAEIGVWFLGIQLCLSYFVSGFAKFLSATWRSGRAVVFVMDTKTYGKKWAIEPLLDYKALSKTICWWVILWETLFPFAMFMDPMIIQAFCVCAILFHVGTAVVMGLNTFAISFPAAIPAAYYVSTKLPKITLF
jgi:hypothetical protein